MPVLLDEVLAAFAPPFRPRTYVDGTLGAGGHASAMLAAHAGRGGPLCLLVGVDVDPAAHAVAGPRLAARAAQEAARAAEAGGGAAAARPPATIRLLKGNHSDISRLLAEVEWPAEELGPHPGDAGGGGSDDHGGAGGNSSKSGSGGGGKRSLLGGVDAMLLDLGVSSMQIDDAGRGFSFVRDGPLDMRMAREEEGGQHGGPSVGDAPAPTAAVAPVAGGASGTAARAAPSATTAAATAIPAAAAGGLTAADIVNTWSEQALAELIRDYGEEKMWRRVAARIVRAREASGPLATTGQLAAAIGRTALRSPAGSGGGRGRRDIHPATRTFQALRIAVNDELAGLARAIPAAVAALAPGGRLAVISFHSLEDRVVKHAMLRAAGRSTPEDEAAAAAAGAGRGAEGEAWRLGREAAAVGRVLTRRPVPPGEQETTRNPRARSAKLRIFEKFGGAAVADAGAGGGDSAAGEGADGPAAAAAAGAAAAGGAGAAAGGKKATHRSKKWRELDEQQQRLQQQGQQGQD